MTRRDFLWLIGLTGCYQKEIISPSEIENDSTTMKKQIIDWWTGSSFTPEIISGATAILSTFKLRPAYTGYALNVKISGTDYDIPFSGYKIDRAYLRSLNSNDTVSTTVNTIYDQSGNGYDHTLVATFTGGYLTYDAVFDNYFIAFLPPDASAVVGYDTSGTKPNTSYQNTSISVNSRAFSEYVVTRGARTLTGMSYTEWNNLNIVFFMQAQNQLSMYDNVAGQKLFPTNFYLNSAPDFSAMSVRANSTNVALNVDNVFANTTSGALTNATPVGHRIGSSASLGASYKNESEWVANIVYGSKLSDANDTSNITTLLRCMNRTTSHSKLVVCYGDSLTLGTGIQKYESYPMKLKKQYPETIRFLASGWYNNTVVQLNTGRAARATQYTTNPAFSSGPSNTVCILWAGINDLSNGDSGATVWTNLQTLITNLKSGGFSKIVLCDMIYSGALSAPKETERQNLNTLIAANWASAGVDAFAQISTLLTAFNATYYLSDGTHLKDAGTSLIYPTIKTALDSVL